MGVKNIIGELRVNGKKVVTTKSGEGLTYALSDDSTYYICTGMGTCTDTELVIPTDYNGLPVKEIGDCAFEYVDRSHDFDSGVTSGGNNFHEIVKKVIIPDSITKIGVRAFAVLDDEFTETFRSTLEYVEMADSVTTLDGSAFRCCYNLKEVKLSKNLTRIDASVFCGCSSLKKIDIPVGVTVIAESAFSRCYNLAEIAIPNTVTVISDFAFLSTNINKLVIPKSVTTVESGVFGEDEIEDLQLTVYCEAESKPDGWNSNWNKAGATVVWGFANDFVSVNEKIGDISTALDELHTYAQSIIGGAN